MINCTQWYTYQKGLDETIHQEHKTNYESTRQERLLAFLVELGELANETRCFKYWSFKPSSSLEVVLEEYVDGLHFLLSIGISYSLQLTTIHPYLFPNSVSTTSCFLSLYELGNSFLQSANEDHYRSLMEYYLGLGLRLGFDELMIGSAYLKKLKVNYDRQEQHY